MITGAWYSTLEMKLDDRLCLAQFPDYCRNMLDTNSADLQQTYNELL
ncbi:TPA: inovirus-type Gp2 protein [Klebsiella pneumoniae]|nr:inovirus-type Gp2 protein [Klebsiella pneumoniae]